MRRVDLGAKLGHFGARVVEGRELGLLPFPEMFPGLGVSLASDCSMLRGLDFKGARGDAPKGLSVFAECARVGRRGPLGLADEPSDR